jgi:hypothetical protein
LLANAQQKWALTTRPENRNIEVDRFGPIIVFGDFFPTSPLRPVAQFLSVKAQKPDEVVDPKLFRTGESARNHIRIKSHRGDIMGADTNVHELMRTYQAISLRGAHRYLENSLHKITGCFASACSPRFDGPALRRQVVLPASNQFRKYTYRHLQAHS